jgi:hypothetical protein
VAQNCELVHETDTRSKLSDPTGPGPFHDEPFQMFAPPPLPTAAQNVLLGHDKKRSPPSVIWLGADHDEPLKVSTLPPSSPATQNWELAHDTDARRVDGSMFTGADQSVWVDEDPMKTLPALPTKAQNVVAGHEIDSGLSTLSTSGSGSVH